MKKFLKRLGKVTEHPILVAAPTGRSQLSQNTILVTMPLATARLMISASKIHMEQWY